MAFDSFSDFLNMGGYAFYVWLSYGVTFALLVTLFISSNQQNKKVRQNIIARQKRENKLRQAAEQQIKMNNEQSDVEQTNNEVVS